MSVQIIYKGRLFEIYAWEHENSCPVIDFLSELDKKSDSDGKRLVYLISRTADEGIIKNEQQSRILEDGIYEFKAPNTARILYFFDKNRIIICTHGFRGKRGKGKTSKTEISRAVEIREMYFREKNND